MAVHPGRWAIFRYVSWRKAFSGARLLGIALALVLCVVRASDPLPLEVARDRTFDFFQSVKPQPVPPQNPVAIVDLDEDSLAAIGQWPWPRTLVAQMVTNLAKAGAVVIGFDIVFAEPDRMSPALVADALPGLDDATRARLRALPSNDAVLAQVMKQTRVVAGQSGLDLPARRTDQMPDIPPVAMIGGDPRPWMEHYQSILRNTPDIDNAAAGWGVFSVSPGADGVVRRVPAVVTDGTNIYPALSLEMLRVGLGNQNFGIRMGPAGIQSVVLRGQPPIQTDGGGDIWLYAARHDPSLYVPAKDVVRGTFDPAKVAGKLVLIGTSATGLQDIRTTAVESHIPGVELHAQIIDTILFKQQLSNPADATGVELVAALIGSLLMVVLVPLVGARWTLLLVVATTAGACGFAWYSFDHNYLLYDPVFPSASTILVFILMTYSSYAKEEAQKKQVRAAFGRYLSPDMVARVAEDPSALRLGGERRDMTLMFCDIRGFTTISEQFDAEGLTKLINRFLSPMTDIIQDRRGTIDKYMGDCIMAFWNAPLDNPEHAPDACRAALQMVNRLGPLNDELEAEARAENRRHVPIKIGIGLNSGSVVVGNMGSDKRYDYSVLGDAVNTASRLEGQSKAYGVVIVIGETTYTASPGFACLELDVIQVKGKTTGVRIYALLGDADMANGPDFKALAPPHDALLAAYRSQDWVATRNLIAQCRELCKPFGIDHLYDLYQERVEEFEVESPGVDWDGVYIAKTK